MLEYTRIHLLSLLLHLVKLKIKSFERRNSLYDLQLYVILFGATSKGKLYIKYISIIHTSESLHFITVPVAVRLRLDTNKHISPKCSPSDNTLGRIWVLVVTETEP